MKKIPKKIIVFGIEYKIRYRKNLRYNGDNINGLHDPTKHEIFIESNLSEEERKDVFWHELGHAIFNVTSMTQGINDSLEEIIVDNYAKMLSKLM